MTYPREVREQQNRADMMEWLYKVFDRDNAPHGKRNTFIGLADEYRLYLGKEEMDRICSLWHDEKTRSSAQAAIKARPPVISHDSSSD